MESYIILFNYNGHEWTFKAESWCCFHTCFHIDVNLICVFLGGKFLSITVSTRWLWEWHRDSPGEKSGLNLSMSSSVSRELRTELEPELLRGVPLDVVLSSWARHFRPPDPGMFQVDHANYDLSKQLDYYDEFLSHDWETSRWYKLCTMMMIYKLPGRILVHLFCKHCGGHFECVEDPPEWTVDSIECLGCLSLGALLLATYPKHFCKTNDGIPRQTLHCTTWWRAEAKGYIWTRRISGPFTPAHHFLVSSIFQSSFVSWALHSGTAFWDWD